MFFIRFSKKTDEELMSLIREGHDKAMSELYSRYSVPLVRYFNRMLWYDLNKAQDFLHDLFVKIIEDPKKFATDKRFSTWIYSIAHNMCKNEYRKQASSKIVDTENCDDVFVVNNIHEQIDEKQFTVNLNKIMQHWEDDDRTLFVLRNETDMTFVEIGLILNCPEGTAKSRWFYLRKNLAKHLYEFHPALS